MLSGRSSVSRSHPSQGSVFDGPRSPSTTRSRRQAPTRRVHARPQPQSFVTRYRGRTGRDRARPACSELAPPSWGLRPRRRPPRSTTAELVGDRDIHRMSLTAFQGALADAASRRSRAPRPAITGRGYRGREQPVDNCRSVRSRVRHAVRSRHVRSIRAPGSSIGADPEGWRTRGLRHR